MIDPVLLSIGGLQIRYYGILYALAFIIGLYIAKKLSRHFNISESLVEDYIPYIIIADIVGARLFEVLFYDPYYYFSHPLKIFAVWEGGLASHGAIIAIILTTYYFCKKNKVNVLNFLDLISIPVALGAAFIRIGNFINSELVGKISSVPWAVKFNGYEGLRHPVQLYQALGHVFIFFILLIVLFNYKNRKTGFIFFSMLLLDSVFRFVTEFYKDLPFDYGFFYLNMNLAQWFSIFIGMICLIFIVRILKNWSSSL